ncbi:hypothetical protein [Streptomyces sp. NPDC051214]|uniref:hypothetical protein n=1 Tax=Streptomyces sp. NPDC051214 TaxID=3155282 RepID=UPI0034434BB8
MDAVDILVRSLSKPVDIKGELMQYHPRSDRHSRIACWGIMFDLLQTSGLLRDHVESGKVAFGINHRMTDYVNHKHKDLDLVLCRPGTGPRPKRRPYTLESLAQKNGVELTADQQSRLMSLPILAEAPVSSVLVALEAKACMTEHGKAGPRLYDELNSSHQIVHGSSNQALSVGFCMVNAATSFYSPTNRHNGGGPNEHNQPRAAEKAIEAVSRLPRRSGTNSVGYDGFGIVVVDMLNDGGTPVDLVASAPAPQPGEIFHYDSMIHRVAHEYDAAFRSI